MVANKISYEFQQTNQEKKNIVQTAQTTIAFKSYLHISLNAFRRYVVTQRNLMGQVPSAGAQVNPPLTSPTIFFNNGHYNIFQ